MKVLRSRVVPSVTDSPLEKSKPEQSVELEPATPAQHQETSPVQTPASVVDTETSESLPRPAPSRRCLRLSSSQSAGTDENLTPGKTIKLESGGGIQETGEMQTDCEVRVLDAGVGSGSGCTTKDKRNLDSDDSGISASGSEKRGFMSLRSGRSVAKRGTPVAMGDSCGGDVGDESITVHVEGGNDGTALGRVGGEAVEEKDTLERDLVLIDNVSPASRRISRDKGKGKVKIDEDEVAKIANFVHKASCSKSNGVRGSRNDSEEERGEDNLVKDENLSNAVDVTATVSAVDPENAVFDDSMLVIENPANRIETRSRRRERYEEPSAEVIMQGFKRIARENASRFAHFYPGDELRHQLPDHVLRNAVNIAPREATRDEVEDWPGPFSTAMKIIGDRTGNVSVPQSIFSSSKCKIGAIKWVPNGKGQSQRKRLVPSLQELCLKVLATNADAITSLDGVPEDERHKLSQLLCDSRKINRYFFDLLIRGSPTELRIKDCSWLTEEELSESFKKCDASKLTVLQLDQCGRCLPDYILVSSVAQSANHFPLLSTISISGACHLTDDGLAALVLSAPALRSINLSQCSLLTSGSIETIANSLGSTLRELYLNDCQSIDPMLILPALKKLEHLEVFSIAGIQSVSDDFIQEFIAVHGPRMKELILSDCMNLTDASLKVIGETCSGLCALNLVNLSNLTDSAIGYLANGCPEIEKLFLCRNTFSDEAIAAFLGTSGGELKELSLNNVRKVGQNTAISLANKAWKLESLDVSWCRNLTDEALGLIADNCSSLKQLRVFGCTQITDLFLDGHSNPGLQIIGLRMSAILDYCRKDVPLLPLKYS